jgi:glycosyltransferase involved in cell wall biosynthesis
MRVHILFEFKDGSWGGGNQFLKSLKKYLQSADVYEPAPAKADVILFNSHQSTAEVARFKLKCPGKLFVHRIDGPMRLYNKMSDKRDNIVFAANKYLADATVFQSTWSQQQNHLLGLPKRRFETVIVNAPEPTVFNRKGKIPFSTQRRVRLIATSWSPNWNKGFRVYQWLDENLDFSKYEMLFVGRTPVEFKNIKHIPLLNSEQLAGELKKSDIFITASQKDPCSNSLIEALHCGLPAVGLRDGGHPEIISDCGETFIEADEIPELLEKIAKNYAEYQTSICYPSISEVAKQYCDFVSQVYQNIQNKKSKVKSFGWISYARIMATICRWKLSEHVAGVISNIRKSR